MRALGPGFQEKQNSGECFIILTNKVCTFDSVWAFLQLIQDSAFRWNNTCRTWGTTESSCWLSGVGGGTSSWMSCEALWILPLSTLADILLHSDLGAGDSVIRLRGMVKMLSLLSSWSWYLDTSPLWLGLGPAWIWRASRDRGWNQTGSHRAMFQCSEPLYKHFIKHHQVSWSQFWSQFKEWLRW